MSTTKPIHFNFKISVAICTYNRAKFLELCIQSIFNLKFSKSDFEVIIVDNNSTDNTSEVVNNLIATYPKLNIKYFLEKKQGVANTRTRCASEAQGNIIAYIDDDCIADENWLNEIVDFYESHPDVLSSGGKIVPKFLVPVASWFSKYFWGLVGNYDLSKKVFRMKGARYPSGANMHFRKLAFDKYGFFDSQLGRTGNSLMAGEEKAMYLKLIHANEKVYYLPQAIVLHHVEGNKFDKNYVKKHSMGIGGSERLMNQNNFSKLIKKFIEYILKLIYAIMYSFGFLIKGQFDKMIMLIKFRWWVIVGFLYPDQNK